MGVRPRAPAGRAIAALAASRRQGPAASRPRRPPPARRSRARSSGGEVERRSPPGGRLTNNSGGVLVSRSNNLSTATPWTSSCAPGPAAGPASHQAIRDLAGEARGDRDDRQHRVDADRARKQAAVGDVERVGAVDGAVAPPTSTASPAAPSAGGGSSTPGAIASGPSPRRTPAAFAAQRREAPASAFRTARPARRSGPPATRGRGRPTPGCHRR